MTAPNVRLFLGDAVDMLRTLPDESVDLIVTDVAYESLEKHRAVGTTTRLKQSEGSSNEWFSIFGNERFEEFFSESFRVLKNNTHLYFYCDQETMFVAKPIGEKVGFKFWKPIVWAKTRQGMKPDADDLTVEQQGMGMGYHFRASHEFILFFEKGKRKLSDLGVRDVLPFPSVKNGYPTEKPVDLNKVLIRLSSEPGETVCDPFMGSASTGVAAVKLGRVFIGCDIKESATVDAQKRLVTAGGVVHDTVVVPSGMARPERPEPSSKKTRTKRVAPSKVQDLVLGTGTIISMPLAVLEATKKLSDDDLGAMATGHDCTLGSLEHIAAIWWLANKPAKVQTPWTNVPTHLTGDEKLWEAVKDLDRDLLDPSTPTEVIDSAAETMGLDPSSLRAEGRSLASTLLNAGTSTDDTAQGYVRHPSEILPPKPTCRHGEARNSCVLCRLIR